MFEMIGQVAERVATNVSRRQFLRRFGRAAFVAAAAVGGLAALPGVSQGGGNPSICGPGSIAGCVGMPEGTTCSAGLPGCYGECRSKHGSDCGCYNKHAKRWCT
jgi:hypothetical protein